MKSIIQTEKECFFCKSTYNLHKHHIFYGTANRRISEKEGCWCYLCANHHNMSELGVHFNTDLDNELKELCQSVWEEKNGTREDFRKLFGRSWP